MSPAWPSFWLVIRSMARWFSKIVMFGCAATAASSARSISRPVMSLAWRMRRLEWPPSRPRSSSRAPCDSGISRSVNCMPSSISSAMRAGPSCDDRADDRFLAQAGAGLQRVAHVQLERILLARDRGDAALGVVGVGLRAVLLGDDGHAPVRRDFQRKNKPAMPLPRTRKSNCFMIFPPHHSRCRPVEQERKALRRLRRAGPPAG